MALRRPKFWFLLIVLGFTVPALSSCGDFRAVFNGKSKHKPSPSSDKRPRKKRRNQPVPSHAKGKFIWPLNAPLSSRYGPRRGRFHEGLDIDGDFGDPIVAAASGEVVFSDRLGSYGKLIIIKHEKGFFTAYAHNKKNLVKKGKKVKQGRKIAIVGSTGRSTGSHLHFEVRDKKGTFDPLAFLPRRRYSRR